PCYLHHDTYCTYHCLSVYIDSTTHLRRALCFCLFFTIWLLHVHPVAPTPFTAYLSVGSKAAGFVVLLRVLRPFLMLPEMQRLLVVIALLTLLYGNLAALPQSNLKRLLAYSSIAHAGYLLIGVACFDGPAVAFYL